MVSVGRVETRVETRAILAKLAESTSSTRVEVLAELRLEFDSVNSSTRPTLNMVICSILCRRHRRLLGGLFLTMVDLLSLKIQ
jgi:hypothetical protein